MSPPTPRPPEIFTAPVEVSVLASELVNDVITELPKDIDYDWYIQFAKNKIKELIKI